MDEQELEKIVLKTFASISHKDVSEVTLDSNLDTDLGIDSLDTIDAIMKLGDYFPEYKKEIEKEEGKYDNITDVRTVYNILKDAIQTSKDSL